MSVYDENICIYTYRIKSIYISPHLVYFPHLFLVQVKSIIYCCCALPSNFTCSDLNPHFNVTIHACPVLTVRRE